MYSLLWRCTRYCHSRICLHRYLTEPIDNFLIVFVLIPWRHAIHTTPCSRSHTIWWAFQLPRLFLSSPATIGGTTTAVALATTAKWKSLMVLSVISLEILDITMTKRSPMHSKTVDRNNVINIRCTYALVKSIES